jgi:hypothetical protein
VICAKEGSSNLSSDSFAGPISKFCCRLQRDEGLIAPAHSILSKPGRVKAQTACTPIGSVDPSQLSSLVVAEGTTQASRALFHAPRQPCRHPEFYLLVHRIAQTISITNIFRQTSKHGEVFAVVGKHEALAAAIICGAQIAFGAEDDQRSSSSRRSRRLEVVVTRQMRPTARIASRKLGLSIHTRQSHSHAAPCLIEERPVNRHIAYGLYHFAASLAGRRPSAANTFAARWFFERQPLRRESAREDRPTRRLVAPRYA